MADSTTSNEVRTLYGDLVGRDGVFTDSRILRPSWSVAVNDTEAWWGDPPLSADVMNSEYSAAFGFNLGLTHTFLDLFHQNVAKDVKSIKISEDIDKKASTFKITLNNPKWLDTEAYTYSDNVLFSPGRRVTIIAGYQLPGGGEFSRPLVYNAPITAISADWGSDGAPEFVIEGTATIDFVLDRIVLPRQIRADNFGDFIKDEIPIGELLWNSKYENGSGPVPFRPLKDNNARDLQFAGGMMNPRNKNIYDLFYLLRRLENVDIRTDPRAAILWYDGYVTGMPNLVKAHGDSYTEPTSGTTILNMGRHTVYFYKSGPFSNVEYAKTTKNSAEKAGHLQLDSFVQSGPGEPFYNKPIHTKDGEEDGTQVRPNYENRRLFAAAYQDFRDGISDLGMSQNQAKELYRDIMTKVCGIIFPPAAGPIETRVQGDAILEQFLTYFHEDEVMRLQEDALRRELAAYTSQLENALEIEIGALGDPIVRPGHIITVFGLGKRFSGEYEVRAVDTTLDSKGFNQKLRLVTNTNVLSESLMSKRDLPQDEIWEWWFRGLEL